MDESQDDQLIMQDSRVMMRKDGMMTLLEEEITLPDGTKIAVDGTVLMPDGTIRMMAEGETILLEVSPAGSEDMTDRQFRKAMEDEELRDVLP